MCSSQNSSATPSIQSDDATFVIGPYVFHPRSKYPDQFTRFKLQLTEKENRHFRFLQGRAEHRDARGQLLQGCLGLQSKRDDARWRRISTGCGKDRKRSRSRQTLVTDAGGYRLVPDPKRLLNRPMRYLVKGPWRLTTTSERFWKFSFRLLGTRFATCSHLLPKTSSRR